MINPHTHGRIKRKPIKRSQRAKIGSGRKKRKKSPLTLAKDKLWAVTRLLVFATYGRDCYTCPQKNLTGHNLQCGHVPWPSADLSVTCRYDIRFLRPQCYNCNMNKGGMGAVALERMKSEGVNTYELRRISETTKGQPQPISFFQEKTQEHRLQLKNITSAISQAAYPQQQLSSPIDTV